MALQKKGNTFHLIYTLLQYIRDPEQEETWSRTKQMGGGGAPADGQMGEGEEERQAMERTERGGQKTDTSHMQIH